MDRKTQSLSALATLAVPVAEVGREYRVHPSVAGARWLFPAGDPAVRRAGVRELFRPRSARGRLFRGLVSAGAWRGGKMFLDEEALSELERRFFEALGEEARVAFYVGTPGAYRKVTAQAVSPSGASLAFAKLAATPPARADVAAERRNLEMLSAPGTLRGRIPEPISAFRWLGSDVLLLGAGPPATGPDLLTAEHLRFMTDLFAPFAEKKPFSGGSMMIGMERTVRDLQPLAPAPLQNLLETSLARLGDLLGPIEVPLSVAHRDFAPWNTRSGPGRLFVFDWDRVEREAPPLYDAFHFAAIQAALFDREDHLPDPRFLRDLLDRLWPEGHTHLPALHLAYLLDQALFYAEARAKAPDKGESAVLDWFVERLEAFPNESPQAG